MYGPLFVCLGSLSADFIYVDDPTVDSPPSSSQSPPPPSEVNGAVNARVAKSEEAAEADKVAETSETEHLSSLDETERKAGDNSASADGGGDIEEKEEGS